MRVTRVWLPVEVIPTDPPISSLCQANSAFHPSEVGKWVPDNTGANSGSQTMRVAPIDHHWWYDRRLSTYDPRSAGRTRADSFNRTTVQVYTVSLPMFNISHFMFYQWLIKLTSDFRFTQLCHSLESCTFLLFFYLMFSIFVVDLFLLCFYDIFISD